jgi:hypothetical protein
VSSARDRVDRAAGLLAGWVLRLLSAQGDPSTPSWIDALTAEMGEIGSGRSRLAWALGGVGLLLRQRLMTSKRRWIARMRWVGSAGGLGGVLVYLPALVGGILMAVGSYGYRDADAPVPVVAAMALTPYYAVVGLWWARRCSIEIAALVGAATALAGYETFVVSAAIYLAATESAVNSLTWLGFGVGFALLVALVGAFCGLIGGTLAHPAKIIRSICR